MLRIVRALTALSFFIEQKYAFFMTVKSHLGQQPPGSFREQGIIISRPHRNRGLPIWVINQVVINVAIVFSCADVKAIFCFVMAVTKT